MINSLRVKFLLFWCTHTFPWNAHMECGMFAKYTMSSMCLRCSRIQILRMNHRSSSQKTLGSMLLHWNGNVFILMKFSTLVALSKLQLPVQAMIKLSSNNDIFVSVLESPWIRGSLLSGKYYICRRFPKLHSFVFALYNEISRVASHKRGFPHTRLTDGHQFGTVVQHLKDDRALIQYKDAIFPV